MTRANSSGVGRRTNVVAQDRWRRLFESLAFGTAHLDNTCALAWYASRPSYAGRSHRRGPLDIAGPDATRARGNGTPKRCTSPPEETDTENEDHGEQVARRSRPDEPEPILDIVERRAPAHHRLDHCTFHQEGLDELGSFVLDGDVWISYTPLR